MLVAVFCSSIDSGIFLVCSASLTCSIFAFFTILPIADNCRFGPLLSCLHLTVCILLVIWYYRCVPISTVISQGLFASTLDFSLEDHVSHYLHPVGHTPVDVMYTYQIQQTQQNLFLIPTSWPSFFCILSSLLLPSLFCSLLRLEIWIPSSYTFASFYFYLSDPVISGPCYSACLLQQAVS